MTPSPLPSLHLFVARIARHSTLSAEERRAVLALPGHTVQVRPNVDFVTMGQTVDTSCLIVEGLAARFGQNSEGEQQITALHIPGDMADLHSAMMPEAGSALQALTPTTLIRVPHKALIALAHSYPNLAEAFWRDSVLDAAILSQWVVNVGRRDAIARMAHFFCEAAVRLAQIGRCSGGRFDFPVTQTHLGEALGLTAVHINRTLKVLRERGLLELNHRVARILDWDGLADIGEFDLAYLCTGGDDAAARQRAAMHNFAPA